MRACFGTVLLCVLASGTASAQRCIGHQTFRFSHFHFAGGIEVDKYAQTWGVDVRYGRAGLFGMAEAALKTWGVETFNNESQKLGATVGVALSRDEKSRISFCPMLSYRTFDGPDEANGIAWHYHENQLAGSANVGFLIKQSKAWEVVPALSLEMGTTNPTMKTKAGTVLGSYGTFCCGKRGFTTVTTALGLILGGTVTVLPAYEIPLDEAGEPAYSLHVVIGLGHN